MAEESWIAAAIAAAEKTLDVTAAQCDTADDAAEAACVIRDDLKTRVEQLQNVVEKLKALQRPASEGRYPL